MQKASSAESVTVQPANTKFFDAPRGFRTWLKRNHAVTSEQWVGFRRVGRVDSGIRWSEAVDQALCFGWIDGVRKRIDAKSYAIRFTPRRDGSVWSAVNIRRVAALEAEGSMTRAGRAAFESRSERKSRTYSYERPSPAELDTRLQKLLRADAKAWKFFRAQAPSYQRKVIHWIMSAKATPTREVRLRRAITAFAAGRKL